MVDLIRYYVEKPGNYDVTIRIRDLLTPNKVDSVDMAFSIEAMGSDKIEIGLSSSIIRARGTFAENHIANCFGK